MTCSALLDQSAGVSAVRLGVDRSGDRCCWMSVLSSRFAEGDWPPVQVGHLSHSAVHPLARQYSTTRPSPIHSRTSMWHPRATNPCQRDFSVSQFSIRFVIASRVMITFPGSSPYWLNVHSDGILRPALGRLPGKAWTVPRLRHSGWLALPRPGASRTGCATRTHDPRCSRSPHAMRGWQDACKSAKPRRSPQWTSTVAPMAIAGD